MIKKSLIFIGLGYLLFLVGMFFIGLGKFASAVFAEGWWVFTKDFTAILGSLATAFAVPWAIFLYFKQREKDRLDKVHEQARELLNELISVLTEGKLIANQIKINSLLYRLQSYIGGFNNPINNNYLYALRTHINQFFNHLEINSLFITNDPPFEQPTYYSSDLPDLIGKNRDRVLILATRMVNAKCYRSYEVGDYRTVNIDKGFSPQILSQLIVIAQPICIGNFTEASGDITWKQDNLKNLFNVLPELIAAYMYLAYSKYGHDLIIRLENNKKSS